MKIEPKYSDLVKPENYDRVGIDNTWKIGFDEAARILNPYKGKKVLDYGSGTGRSSRFLKSLGLEVVGVDNDPKMVEFAREHNLDMDYYSLDSNTKIPFNDETFNACFASFVHVTISSRVEFYQIQEEVSRILKPYGLFVILTANPRMWGHEYHSFFNHMPDDFRGKSGDRIYVELKENPPICGYDYFWEYEDYLSDLYDFNFHQCNDEYPLPVNDLTTIPPFMLITAHKS